MPDDRRVSVRVELISLANVDHMAGKSGQVTFSTIGKTINISQNGALIEVYKQVPLRGRLLLKMTLRENILQMHAAVIWHKHEDGRFLLGLRFESMDAHSRSLLESFVNQQSL